MTRLVKRYVSLHMLALWSLESLLSFCLAYELLGAGRSANGPDFLVVNQALILALTIGATAFVIGLYRPEVFRRTRGMLINTALGGLLTFPAAWLVSKAVGMNVDRLIGYDAFWPTKIIATWIVALFAMRLLFLAAVRSNLFVRTVALLGPVSAEAATVVAIRNEHRGFLDFVSGPVANIGPVGLRAAGVRDAVLSQSAYGAMLGSERAEYVAEGVLLETEARFWERCLKRVDVAHLNEDWSTELDSVQARSIGSFINRSGDLVISVLLLLLTLPLMLMVALLIRMESGGPILYYQKRIGLNGRPFTLFKFRSMHTDAEMRGPAWAVHEDPRVTRVGAFIRRTRIDELPQLINILQGTMGFIGPRPERPHFVEQLAKVIPFYGLRARVKPGLTGWAQVNFPYGASVEDARVKLSYDLYYVKHRSMLLDVAILFSTIRVILLQEGSR